MNKNNRSKRIFFLVLALGIILGTGLTIIVTGLIDSKNAGPDMLTVESSAKQFIKDKLLSPDMQSDIFISSEMNDVYEVTVTVGTESVTSYVSKDGTLLFPVGYELVTIPVNNGQTNVKAPVTDVVKTDKPKVELFVMSYCPYGLQAEKGILPVVEALGDNIDFELRFVNYIMHGEKEAAENTRQYCIQKTQNEKLVKYLACYSEAGDAIICGEQVELSEAMIDVCVKEADDEYNIASDFAAKETWLSGQFPIYRVDDVHNKKYGVQGSPTLVINGVVTNTGRDSESFLETICEAFNNAPEECNNKMDSTSPSPGFGFDASTAGVEGICK